MSDNESSPEIGSNAFAPENFNTVMVIQMARLYDVMMMLLATMDPEKAAYLEKLHEHGGTMCPPPAFAEEENEDLL